MLYRIPVVAFLLGIMALVMLVPAIQAGSDGEWKSARGFLYPALFGFFIAGALGVLLRPMRARETPQHELLMLLLVWLTLPVFAAIPVYLLTPAIGPVGAWFEMVAALTTTGGSVYAKASEVAPSIHLWRGLCGWMGGLLTLMAAYVVLAPRKLGGYEILAAADGLAEGRPVDLRTTGAGFQSRSDRALRTILPIYLGLTLFLALCFSALGKPGLIAAVHAMSIVSTSGITPVDAGFAGTGSFWAELIAVAAMILAASRLLYSPATMTGRRVAWRDDPEIQLLLSMALLAAFVLFARHWIGVLTIDAADAASATEGFRAFWGALFTTISFATTTGFQSFAWESARDWSGLANPSLVLLALCTIGGGAATTAGGIKLIRAYALVRHGIRELERIASPNSVAGSGSGSRGLRREGAMLAWAFMMLFFLALLGAILALTWTGMDFTDALVASSAALSNTGPAYAMVSGRPEGFAFLDAVQHIVLAVAMILGRIETLAVIALFNADYWRAGPGRRNRTGKTNY